MAQQCLVCVAVVEMSRCWSTRSVPHASLASLLGTNTARCSGEVSGQQALDGPDAVVLTATPPVCRPTSEGRVPRGTAGAESSSARDSPPVTNYINTSSAQLRRDTELCTGTWIPAWVWRSTSHGTQEATRQGLGVLLFKETDLTTAWRKRN